MKVVMTDEFVDQSLLEKARWFATLSIEERMAWLDEWTEIILQNNPVAFQRFDDDKPIQGTLRLVRKTQR
jgi:hypothetical protein